MAGAPGGWESVIREKLERRRRKAQRWKRIRIILTWFFLLPIKQANSLLK